MWWKRWLGGGPEDRFREAKIHDYFAALDADGDGALQARDFSRVVQELAAELGWDAQRVQEAERAWLALWNELLARMDEDGDGTISRPEFHGFFLTAASQQRTSGVPPEWALEHVRAVMHAIDTDGDGCIEPDELAAWYRALRREVEVGEVFRRLDLDGDGQVDVDEVDQLFGQWLAEGTPSGPGNWLLTGSVPTP